MDKFSHRVIWLFYSLARALTALAVCLALFVFGCFWLARLLSSISSLQNIYFHIAVVVSAAIAALMASQTWKCFSLFSHGKTASVLGNCLAIASMVGMISFIAGGIVPYFIDPHAEQGFFLAFITGPAGFIVGAAGVFIYSYCKRP